MLNISAFDCFSPKSDQFFDHKYFFTQFFF